MRDGEMDYGRYEDKYLEKVRDLIDAKVEGREIVTPDVEEDPDVLNLMDALRKSISDTQGPTRKRRSKRSRRRRAS